MNRQRIRHQVIFELRWPPESPQTKQFLNEGKILLSAIPGVENFSVLRQVSPKNDFHFGFSMDFADREAYQTYNEHPDHVSFVENHWKTEVTRFLEIDFEEIEEAGS